MRISVSEFSSQVHETDDFQKELKDMDTVTKELAVYSQQLYPKLLETNGYLN